MMSCTERALQAIRSQLQFELLQAAADLGRAVSESTRRRQDSEELLRGCTGTLAELRAALRRPMPNPLWLQTLQRWYQRQQQAAVAAQAQAAAALEHERRARQRVAELRNRERSLDRACDAELRKQRRRRMVIAQARNDDWWLQQLARGTP
jgi:hypothetical protein